MSIENILKQNSRTYPEKVAVVSQGRMTTYSELWKLVIRRAWAMRRAGVSKGSIHLFRASQNIDFLLTYFATHLLGAVAAPLEHDMPEERFRQVQERAKSVEIPEETADILFTTGTTGVSKGVMISGETIIAEAENLADSQGFRYDTVFVISGPLNHIGSLSKVYPVVYVGATLYITEGVKDMESFFNAFEYPSKSMATFLVPASIRMLLQFAKERLSKLADKIDFIETGAAAMAQTDMEELCRLLPRTRLYNTYASTETGIIATHNFNSEYCVAGCLGKAMKHSRFYITEEGLIACEGKTLMVGYIGNDQQGCVFRQNSVLVTSDRGYVDREGRLNLLGRADDVINVGGYKVNPLEVENVALSFPSVQDCICISVHHTVLGSVLKLLVVPNEVMQFNKQELALYIRSKLESHKVPWQYEVVEFIHRTYNGKLDRKRYAVKDV